MRVLQRFIIVIFSALACLFALACTEGRADQLLPQLDTRGHTATIRDIAVTADGRLMLSAGFDKTVRVWDLQQSRTIRVLRGTIGGDNHGRIYAMAVAPAGPPLVAVGGLMDENCSTPRCGEIRLFDYIGGRQISVLRGHTSIIRSLAFSQDGRYLASSGGDDAAIIWDVRQRREVARHARTGTPLHRVTFLADGRNRNVAIAAEDGTVHVLDRVSRAIVRSVDGGGVLKGLAGSPDGKYLAAGARDGRIHVWDTTTWTKVRTIDNGTAVEALAFGYNTTRHQVAAATSSAPYKVKLWNVATGAETSEFSGHDNTTLTVAFSPTGTRVFSAGDDNSKAIRIWSVTGPANERVFAGGGATIRAVGFIARSYAARAGAEASGDATADRTSHYIAWGSTDPCPNLQSCPDNLGRLTHAMRLPSARNPTLDPPEALVGAEHFAVRHGTATSTVHKAILKLADRWLDRQVDASRAQPRYPLLVEHRPDGGETRIGEPRGRDRGEDHLAYTYDPSGKRIVSGGRNGLLEGFAADGGYGVPHVYAGHQGDVWSVAPSPSGHLIVSGSADQTIRLWNAETAELVVSLLHLSGSGSESWVMWTPQGFYASSQRGDQLVGWHVNNAKPEEAADFVTARQASRYFFRPDVVAQAIVRASAQAAIKALGLDGEVTVEEILKHARPRARIMSPRSGAVLDGGRVALQLDLADNADSPLQTVAIYVNETRVDGVEATGGSPIGAMLKRSIPLARGPNVVRVVVTNDAGLTTEDAVEVDHPADGALDQRGTLVVVAVGVNRYPHKDATGFPNDLTYSVPDATKLAAVVADRLYTRHASGVEVLKLVTDGTRPPTRANIETTLDRLRRTAANDTVVLYLAGHGLDDPREGYLFLPQDARRGPEGWESGSIVKWFVIEEALRNARGRRLVFIDTCQSAGAVSGRLIKPLGDDEVIAYMAASRVQDAWEYAHLGHGAFTWSIMEGLGGAAEVGSGRITALGLGHYVTEKVKELTGGKQEPDFYRGPEARDFVLVRD